MGVARHVRDSQEFRALLALVLHEWPDPDDILPGCAASRQHALVRGRTGRPRCVVAVWINILSCELCETMEMDVRALRNPHRGVWKYLDTPEAFKGCASGMRTVLRQVRKNGRSALNTRETSLCIR